MVGAARDGQVIMQQRIVPSMCLVVGLGLLTAVVPRPALACPFDDAETCALHDAVIEARALEARLNATVPPPGPPGRRGDPGLPGPAGAPGQRGAELDRDAFVAGLRTVARINRELVDAYDLYTGIQSRVPGVRELIELIVGEVEHLEGLRTCVVNAETNNQTPKDVCPL